jgi:hypothetical protein
MACWAITSRLRDDNLLALHLRVLLPPGEAHQDLQVNLKLATPLTLTGLNQLWVADINLLD